MTESPTSDPVMHALLTAQAQGRVKLDEMIYELDNLIADRCTSMTHFARLHGHSIDWTTWGRRTHVLEEALHLLVRISEDAESQAFLRKRLLKRAVDKANESPSTEAMEEPA
jgi:hypothetical protein